MSGWGGGHGDERIKFGEGCRLGILLSCSGVCGV
jgi:hypothetical protein